MMVYYGGVDKHITNFTKIYEILGKALLNAPEDHPYRGPESVKEGDFEYKNNWTGEIDEFSGQEAISHQNEQLYWK